MCVYVCVCVHTDPEVTFDTSVHTYVCTCTTTWYYIRHRQKRTLMKFRACSCNLEEVSKKPLCIQYVPVSNFAWWQSEFHRIIIETCAILTMQSSCNVLWIYHSNLISIRRTVPRRRRQPNSNYDLVAHNALRRKFYEQLTREESLYYVFELWWFSRKFPSCQKY